jgi:hypothetical protein
MWEPELLSLCSDGLRVHGRVSTVGMGSIQTYSGSQPASYKLGALDSFS